MCLIDNWILTSAHTDTDFLLLHSVDPRHQATRHDAYTTLWEKKKLIEPSILSFTRQKGEGRCGLIRGSFWIGIGGSLQWETVGASRRCDAVRCVGEIEGQMRAQFFKKKKKVPLKHVRHDTVRRAPDRAGSWLCFDHRYPTDQTTNSSSGEREKNTNNMRYNNPWGS